MGRREDEVSCMMDDVQKNFCGNDRMHSMMTLKAKLLNIDPSPSKLPVLAL